MTRDDDARPTCRTPSGWHDDASSRDAGHDEMQAMILRWWLRERLTIREKWRNDPVRDFFFHLAEVEFPFLGFRGRITGFADIGLCFRTKETDEEEAKRTANPYGDREYNARFLWVFAELKPRIGSVGAVIRQCRATEVLAKEHFREWREPPELRLWPIVYNDDPKADLLEEMFDMHGRVVRHPRGGQ